MIERIIGIVNVEELHNMVKEDPDLFRHVSDERKTQKMCDEAVMCEHTSNFEYVPKCFLRCCLNNYFQQVLEYINDEDIFDDEKLYVLIKEVTVKLFAVGLLKNK